MSRQPDTRVRLSAEGVKEVIDAYRKIQSEAAKTGKATAKSFDLMTEAGKQFAAILPAVSIASAVASIGLLTKRALDTADSIGKLSQKTGLASETISVLAFAARTADVEQEQLNQGLIKFQRTMGNYTAGVSSAVDATEQLFGSRKALEGLNDDQRFLKVAKALGEMADGEKKTTLAMEFFGKAGAELIPLLNDLANRGFANVRKEAEKLGLVFDDTATSAAERANDAITRLTTTVDGLANSFALGLAPALATAAEIIADDFGGKGLKTFEEIGRFIGAATEGLVVFVTTLELGVEAIARTAAAVAGSLHLLTEKGVGPFLDSVKASIDEIDADIAARLISITARINLPAVKNPPSRGGDTTKNLNDDRKDAAARIALQQQLLDQELALFRAHLKLRSEVEKDAFESGLLTIQQFFSDRRALAQSESDQEIETLREQAALENSLKTQTPEERAAKEKKLADIKHKIALQEIELQTTLFGLTVDEGNALESQAKTLLQIDQKLADATKDHQRSVELGLQAELDALDEALKKQGVSEEDRKKRAFELEQARRKQISDDIEAARKDNDQKAAEAQGRRFEAARIQLDIQAKEEEERLRSQLVPENELALRVGGIFDPQRANIDFQETKSDAERALADIQRDRELIQAQVNSGQLFPFEAEKKILDVERERIPALQELAARMQALAQASRLTDNIDQANEFSDAIRDLAIKTDVAAQRMARLRATLEDSTQNALEDFFTTGIDGAHSLGDAFAGLALSVIQSLRKIAAEMIATAIRQKLLASAFNFFSGIGGGGRLGNAGAGDLGGAGALHAATGGFISGPGTSTSDSIPAWLSHGEYVVNAAAVSQPGILEALEEINRIGTRRIRSPRFHFAGGGLVDATVHTGAGAGRGELTIHLDETLLVKHLESNPEFPKMQLRTLNRNRKAAKSVLGG